MSDEIELLCRFRADVPAPTEAARLRLHTRVTQTKRPASLAQRLKSVRPQGAPRIAATPRARVVRLGIALVALALGVGGTAIAFTTTASGAQSVDQLLSQVRNTFGDSRLLSASVSGSTLTV